MRPNFPLFALLGPVTELVLLHGSSRVDGREKRTFFFGRWEGGIWKGNNWEEGLFRMGLGRVFVRDGPNSFLKFFESFLCLWLRLMLCLVLCIFC